jgi:[ribosomal protein S18]-alanine N-acetyltransferase
MNVRLATSGDFVLLAAIHGECFADAWSTEALKRLMDSPGVFGLLSGDGFVLARVAADEAEILSLGVRPSARRSGQGRLLVMDAAAQGQARGAAAMFLEVGSSNMAARSLYEALGFHEVGLRKGYYRADPPEDALTLRAELPLTRLGKAGNPG